MYTCWHRSVAYFLREPFARSCASEYALRLSIAAVALAAQLMGRRLASQSRARALL
jgi:hypothetical protein